MQNTAIQAELNGTKTQLAEATQNLMNTEAANKTFQLDLDQMNKTLEERRTEASELKESLNASNAKYEELNSDFESLVTINDKLDKENIDFKLNNSVLQQNNEAIQRSNKELIIKCDSLNADISRLQDDISEMERTFPERLENSERVKSLKEKIVYLEDDVSEKKQVSVDIT